jgi:hypothetical protein
MPDKPRTTLVILICLVSLAGCTYVQTATHQPDRADLEQIAKAHGLTWQIISEPTSIGTEYCAEAWRWKILADGGKLKDDFEVECRETEAEAIADLIKAVPYIGAKETVIDRGGE